MSLMLWLLSVLKLVFEIALLALAGQGVLALLCAVVRSPKERNVFYRVLQAVGQPFVGAARWVTPRQVLDRHLPLVAFLVLLLLWIAVTLLKIRWCLHMGLALCR